MKRFIVAAVLATAAVGIGSVALARTLQYRASPVGAFEVPAVDTSAAAELRLKVANDGESARFDLEIVEPIDDAFMAHLHLGPAGTNGSVVVWLYPIDGPPAAPPNGEDFVGRLSRGTITVDNLVGPLDNDWEGFLEALESGGLYVNVHTTDHTGGEIRDQVTAHPHG